MSGDMWSDPSQFFDGAMKLFEQFTAEAEQQQKEFNARHPDGVEIEFTDGEKITVGGRESAGKINNGEDSNMAVRRVTKKQPAKKVNGTAAKSGKTTKPKNNPPAKVVSVRVQFDVMISVGQDDSRSFEEFRDDMVTILKDQAGAKNVTPMSGYYLVNGKVCLPDDYDPETRDFKPGRRPPMWAMSADEQKIAQRIEREKKLPEIARQPTHLRTSTETDEYHELLKKDPEAAREHRKNEVRKSLEGIERRSQIVEDVEDVEDEDDIEDVEEFEDDEPDDDDIEDVEDEWEEGEEFDEEAAEDVVSNSSTSILARLRAKKTTRK